MGGIWFMLAAMATLMCCCAVAGYWIARWVGYSPAVVLAGLVTAAMLLFAQYLSDSVWIAQVIPARALLVFGNWLPPLAGMLAGIGWVISRRPAWIKGVILAILLVCAICLPYTWLFAAHPTVRNVWLGDLCLQTTNATCGAAAAATLLNSVGIASDEQEMTDLCFTTWRGTPLHGVISGLAKKTAGTPWRVKVLQTNAQDLMKMGEPAILRVGLDSDASRTSRYVQRWGWIPGVAHMVVLSQVDADGRMRIADPSTGWETWNPETLNVLWQGVAIVLVPRDPRPAPVMVSR